MPKSIQNWGKPVAQIHSKLGQSCCLNQFSTRANRMPKSIQNWGKPITQISSKLGQACCPNSFKTRANPLSKSYKQGQVCCLNQPKLGQLRLPNLNSKPRTLSALNQKSPQ